VQARQRLTHTLRLSDESTPTRRARPKGVLGAEVWLTLIDAGQPAPTDPSALPVPTVVNQGRWGESMCTCPTLPTRSHLRLRRQASSRVIACHCPAVGPDPPAPARVAGTLVICGVCQRKAAGVIV